MEEGPDAPQAIASGKKGLVRRYGRRGETVGEEAKGKG
jgi:hypothetical protein